MKSVMVAVFQQVGRRGDFREIRHDSVEALGLSLVFANEDDLCAVGTCQWCDRIRHRVLSRAGQEETFGRAWRKMITGKDMCKELKGIVERIDQISTKMLEEIQGDQEEKSESDR